jgi:hypothetical protein
MEIISRKEAMDRGLKYYFTGKPCNHGHIEKRQVLNHGCVRCLNERAKLYSKKIRDSSAFTESGNLKHEQPLREKTRQEAIKNGDKQYFHGIPCKRGHIAPRQTCNGYCMECNKEKNATSKMKKYKQRHKEENRERYAEIGRIYKKKWKKDNPYYFTEYYIKRTERLKRATPDWVDIAEIHYIHQERKKISLKTGVEHHVDHIIPIQRKDVCGLNVPWNLRIITAKENKHKCNNLPPQEQLRFRG